jgi:hypothetical protein
MTAEVRDAVDFRRCHAARIRAELRNETHRAARRADTVIDLGAAAGHAAGQDVLTLAGIRPALLNAQDFLFA